MYWPDTGTGVDTEPARKPVASAVRKYFTEGGVGVPPTVPGGDWFNAITNEVLNVLAAAGIDPSKNDDDQLLQAIQITSQSISAREALRRSYAEAGYNLVDGSFEQGGTVAAANDVLLHLATGSAFSWNGMLPYTVPAKSTPDAGWTLRGGELLRSQLLEKRVYAIDFGRVSSDAAVNTLTIQMAADYVYAAGGGVVDLGPYKWGVDASTLNETYDNYGVPVAASTGCVILRKGVSLIGQPGRTKLYTTNKNATLIYMIAPAGNVVSGFEIDGGWNPGDAGGNNGIFTLATTGGVDKACDRVHWSDLYIHNVASYGLALQNGNPRGCSIARIRVDNIGADGLDLKARGDLAVPAQANSAEDIWVSRHNQRVDGSAGVDVRGIWHLRGITVTDFGGDPTRTYVGVRFRTKPAPIDPQQVADKTTLTGFTIRPTIGSAALSIAGIECGSDDTHISDGYVEDCHHNVIHTGNVNGSAIRGTVTDVTSINARQYGFRNAGGTQGIKYVGCEDVGAVTAGFRIEGDNCTTVGCTGTLSVSSGALPTFLQTGCKFGASFVVLERQTDTSVSVTAKGTAADIALRLSVKGTSFVGFNGDLRPDTANTKYLGSGSLPMAGGFTQTAFAVTSDERLKVNIASILNSDDEGAKAEFMAMRAAWRELDLFMYQLTDRVEKKRAEGKEARWHLGIVAQRAIAAFVNHGLDWTKYSIFNYDKWDSSPAVTNIIPAVLDEEGNEVEPERVEVLSPAIEAGDKYTINYEEALILAEAVRREDQAKQDAFNQSTLERLTLLEAQLNVGN